MTIVFAGNASLASKIREITDVGRVAAVQVEAATSSTAPETVAAAPKLKSAISREGLLERQQALKDNAAHGLAHNKKAPRKNSVVVAAAPVARSHAVGESSAGPLPKEAGVKRKAQSSEMKPLVASQSEGQLDQEGLSGALEEAELRYQQEITTQEMRIRREVAEEMGQRSMAMMEQIQALRTQLDLQQSGRANDVTKSCKKARREQLEVAQQHSSADLREAEEELERLKTKHEATVAALSEANRVLTERNLVLERENSQFRAREKAFSEALAPAAQAAAKPKAEGKRTSSVVRSAASNNNENEAPATAANEFSQRMQRDPRFKKAGDENAVPTKKQQFERSPNRVPLSPVKVDSNSPAPDSSLAHKRSNSPFKAQHNVSAIVSAINSKPAFSVKAVPQTGSPQRLRMPSQQPPVNDENIASASAAPAPYFTRLRSMVR